MPPARSDRSVGFRNGTHPDGGCFRETPLVHPRTRRSLWEAAREREELGTAVRGRVKVVAPVLLAAGLAAGAAGDLAGASGVGDSRVEVRGLAFPANAATQLNLVGCASVFGRSAEAPTPMMGVVPGGPAGKRSLGFDLTGGNAVGPVSYVDHVAATTVAGL